MKETLLIVDDERDILVTLNNILSTEGYRVKWVRSGNEAIPLFQSEPIDLVITDVRMPGMDGLELMRRMKALDEYLEVIIMTGFASVENAVQALRENGAFDYLCTPIKIEQLKILIAKIISFRKMLNAINKTNHYKKLAYTDPLTGLYNRGFFDNEIILSYYRFIYSSITPIRAITAAKKLANSTDYFLENINSLNQNDYVSTRYEDICSEPDAEIKKIMHFLNIKPESEIIYNDFIKPRKTTELKELQMIKSFILKRMKDYLSYCNYIK